MGTCSSAGKPRLRPCSSEADSCGRHSWMGAAWLGTAGGASSAAAVLARLSLDCSACSSCAEGTLSAHARFSAAAFNDAPTELGVLQPVSCTCTRARISQNEPVKAATMLHFASYPLQRHPLIYWIACHSGAVAGARKRHYPPKFWVFKSPTWASEQEAPGRRVCQAAGAAPSCWSWCRCCRRRQLWGAREQLPARRTATATSTKMPAACSGRGLIRTSI